MGILFYLTVVVIVFIAVFVICYKIVLNNCKFVGNFSKDENGLDNFILVSPGEYNLGIKIEDKENNLCLVKRVDDSNSIYFEIFSSVDSLSVTLSNMLKAIRIKDGETVKVEVRKRYNDNGLRNGSFGEIGYIVLKGDVNVEQNMCYISPVGINERI